MINLHLLPPLRKRMYNFVSSPRFEGAIMGCILLNTVLMAMEIFPSPGAVYNDVGYWGNRAFAIVFNIEDIMKLYAMRRTYFTENWNNFDFTCVVLTDGGMILDAVSNFDTGSVMSALRLFRVARLFRLVRFLKGLNRLFNAFILSLPKLANVGSILFLLIFLFAVLGVDIFAKVRLLGAHNEQANFKSFWRAIITLLRCMTGEAWNDL